MKRWVAGAVTVLAAAGGLAAAGPATASSGAWYQTFQVDRSGNFLSIAAISNTNIWAVGDLFGKRGGTIYQPLIRHYDGTSWKTVTLPGSPKFESDQVSASAATNVWLFGFTSSSVATSVAYRYDGSHWHKIPLPAQTDLQGAVTLGPRNVWAFGGSGTIAANVFHWNGSRWRSYNLANGDLMPESISASGTNNVWIAGAVNTRSGWQAVAYRWNGSGWHKAGMPLVRTDIPAVAAFSRSNVWIGWNTETSSRVTHWDGHQWHTMTTPGDINANTTNIVPDGRGGSWFGFGAILKGQTWTSEPAIEISGGLGSVVRIRGTESFLLPATVKISDNSTIQRPTIYRFDL